MQVEVATDLLKVERQPAQLATPALCQQVCKFGGAHGTYQFEDVMSTTLSSHECETGNSEFTKYLSQLVQCQQVVIFNSGTVVGQGGRRMAN